MRHVILIDKSLNGREYGTLRAFENEIIRQTNASVIYLPKMSFIESYAKHSSRYSFLRKFFFKKKLDIPNDTEVIWSIMMGPENYRLDVFSGYNKINKRIIYFFDTLPHQYYLLKKLFKNDVFNYKICSFNDSHAKLEEITGTQWFYIPQASSKYFFPIVQFENRIIAFSSFGRRDNYFHEILKEFCFENNLFYNYTLETPGVLTDDSIALYNNYGWHLSHSVFNIGFNVNITHPERSLNTNPITCRWFESALALTPIIGEAPNNDEFYTFFPSDFVVKINLSLSREEIKQQLNKLWNDRIKIHNNIVSMRDQSSLYDWRTRVLDILKKIGS